MRRLGSVNPADWTLEESRLADAAPYLLEALQAIANPTVPNCLGLSESRLYLAQHIARIAIARTEGLS